MTSITVNQQGSHKVKGNGFGKFAEYIYSVIRNAASDILHGASVLACVVLAVALLSSCGDDKDMPVPGDTTAPVIKVVSLSVDISGGKQVKVKDNELYVGNVLVASWTDNVTKNCMVELTLNSKPLASGTTIDEPGVITIKVTDDEGNSAVAKISVSQGAVNGLENLRKASLQVDKESNLLDGIKFENGASLAKMEIETDGDKNEITDPRHFTPQYPGTCNIILTVNYQNGATQVFKIENLTIKALEYKAMGITNLRPVDILPIIGQVQAGDKNVYSHIEHLRVAEATRIRDMMWKYGAGNHSPAEYQQLMSRLNTGMAMELPLGYDNYEVIGGGDRTPNPDNHALGERHTLNSIVPNANLKIVLPSNNKGRAGNLLEYARNNPNSISIVGLSTTTPVYDKFGYINTVFSQDLIDLCNRNNIIVFVVGTNITQPNGIVKNKIYNEEYTADEHGIYSQASMGNSKNNSRPNSHLLITIATDSDGNIDQTGITYESTKYPVGFAKNSLFSGRGFPHLTEGKIYGPQGRYKTSDTNYLNVALSSLIFQLHADATNVNELLEMIRSTTLTDQITLDGETQQLQLMNPAGFFKKYCMPTGLPTLINTTETVSLNKGYYKGVIFEIPGAEVKIDGQWIAYNDANKSVIKAQNPFSLEWRINGDLCKKMGYKGKTATGKVIVVDDKWNGLNISSDFNVSIQ